MAVYDGRQVQIYGFDLQDCHVHQSTKTCPVDGDLLPLSDLFVYNIEDEATTEIKSHILIGISATENVIYSWELILRQDDFDIKSRGKQEMNWEEPPVKAVSASQWATNTASKLFHRLTFDKRVAMALCVGSTIIFYNMHLPSNDGIIEWNTLYSIQVSSSLLPIHHIKFCSPNTLAVVSGNDSTQLSIWSEIRVGVAPVCERTLHFK